MSREHFLYPPSTFDLAIAVAQTDASNRFLYPTEDEMFTSITRMSTSFRSGLLAVISLIAAIPAYPQQTGTSQAASGQSDNAALQQKIRDLEDRLIALAGDARVGTRLPGDHRSLCARRFFPVVWRRRGKSGGGIHHLHCAAGGLCRKGREDAVRIWESQYHAQPRPALGRSAAGDEQSGGRRGWP